ncbi:M1 family aminopeptidase [Jiulongibacter sediminis]|jgi:aminopeptidase N|uniref:M1 family aminopeptidase n=1 Tax=Jiulongibacter sediminis TaxID=1605367 RepID=UPI0026F0C5B8|nr:M1 family aminopeptidase [Jiulongibacter sediminis]
MKYNLIIFLLLLLSYDGHSQYILNGGVSCATGKQSLGSEFLSKKNLRFPGDATIDAGYYFLDLKIDPSTKWLEGRVESAFTVKADQIGSFFLDLSSSLRVDSVFVNAKKVSYSHSSGKINISLEEPLSKDQSFTTTVYYQGVPLQSPQTYTIEFTTHGGGQPVIWTLSEPYDTPSWWPCIDNPADKADSCDVWITLPTFYTAVSQGILQETVSNQDGTQTAKWKHRYPIAHYLISIAASNYQKLERSFEHAGGTMPVVDYVYPELVGNPALAPLLGRTVDMLEVFSEAYGEYPFINEKYGHAMFGFGGGMEHQTISSMGTFSFGLIAHELGHQWFGDKVTCKTWRDIWINEGFAEFSDLYAREQLQGNSAYLAEVSSHMEGAKQVSGTVAIQNTGSVNEIFNYSKTYQKGSIIVHMLRGVMGDDLFFATLKEFQNTEFAYGAASIEDFQLVAERVYGESLQWFFDQWLFGTGYPVYTYGWGQEGDQLMLEIKHYGTEETQTFIQPVEIEIQYANGSTERQRVFVDQNEQLFEINGLQDEVSAVIFDPENWILKDVTETELQPLSSVSNNIKAFPNPTTDLIFLKGIESLESPLVYDQRGRKQSITFDRETLNVKYLPAGRYFIHINAEGKSLVKSFIKL